MYAFDRAIEVLPDESSREFYHAELLQAWAIGAVPHGGYLLAILLNAAKRHSSLRHEKLGQVDPVQMSTAFIVKCQIGPARIKVEELKIGRGYSNYKLTLQQKEQGGHWVTCIHAFVIMGCFEREGGQSLTTTTYHIPPRNSCVEVEPVFGNFRHAAKNFDYWEAKTPRSPAVEHQWLAFKDGRPMDLLAMAMISDLMMPLPLRVIPNEAGWYPTLSLDLQFKQAAKVGGMYTYLQVESDSIKNGRMDYSTRCFDADHNLIALSRHSALMVSAARNLSKRSDRPKL